MLNAIKHAIDVAMEWFRRPDPMTTSLCHHLFDEIHDDLPAAERFERQRRWLEAQEFHS